MDNIKIVRKRNVVSVFDNGRCVNTGNRPVDHNFAARVYNTLVEVGYKPTEFKGETTFKK